MWPFVWLITGGGYNTLFSILYLLFLVFLLHATLYALTNFIQKLF
jgi:hypothetical protein